MLSPEKEFQTLIEAMSPDEVKVAAIGDWLKEQFPGLSVDSALDAKRLSQFYRISEGVKLHHRVFVHEDFIDDHTIEEIAQRFGEWKLVAFIKAAGARAVTVTNHGPGVAGD